MAYNALRPYTPKQTARQARYAVRQTYSPLFAQLNRRESGNQAAIRDYTQRLIQQLGPVANQVGGYYQQAETQQQGVNSELANRLNSVGGQEASALQAKLAQAGIGGTGQEQRVSAVGSGAANTGAALGSANLSSLLASGAAQTAYAGKLPGIAALGGLQFARQNLAQMEQQRGDLQAREASAIPGELSQLQNLEFQKAAASLGFAGTQQKLQQQTAYEGARLGLTKRQQDLSHADRVAGRQVTQANKQQAAAQKRKTGFYSVRSKTFTEAARLYKGTTQKTAGTKLTPGGTKTVQVPYGTAYKRLWTQYGTQLTQQYGYKRSAVDTMIRRALSHAGYKKPLTQQQAAAKGAAAAAALPGQIGF